MSAALFSMGGFDVSVGWARCVACVWAGAAALRQRWQSRRSGHNRTRPRRLQYLQDLLPAELASGRRPGTTPMRPGFSPPRAAAPSSAGAPPAHQAALQLGCLVDGVPDNVVDAWFREADKDGDGRVADSEARTFFLTSGLAPPDLSKVRCCKYPTQLVSFSRLT